jgi:transposase-like protein
VLAGVKTNLVSEADLATQQRILDSLGKTEQGRKKLLKIRHLISKTNHCPNCFSNEIKVQKRSFFFTRILGLPEKYTCLSCNYNWER